MITRNEHLSLTSEINTLEQLLSEIPDDRILEKRGLSRRLSQLKQEAETVSPSVLPKRLKLTFRGRPVIRSTGFFSDFASEAIGKFTEAVKMVVAGVKNDLRYRGPIPGASDSNLLITGIAKGSFGFEFEVPTQLNDSQGTLYDDPSETEFAIEKVRDLIEIAVSENDDEELSEIVDEIHPRAVKKVKEFLDVLSQRGALCTLDFNGRSFGLVDGNQLDLGRRRLDDDNIRESEELFDGEIQGVLPKSRTFEFIITSTGEMVKPKIGREIEDPGILNREYLYQLVKISLHLTQVGEGRPRYVLHSLPDLQGLGDPEKE